MPGFPVLHQLLELFKLMSFESVKASSSLILCRPLAPLWYCPELSLSATIFLKWDLLWGPKRLPLLLTRAGFVPRHWALHFNLSGVSCKNAAFLWSLQADFLFP